MSTYLRSMRGQHARAPRGCGQCKHCELVPSTVLPQTSPCKCCSPCSAAHAPVSSPSEHLHPPPAKENKKRPPVRSSGATCASDSLARLPANAMASSASASAAIMRRLRFASDAEARPWRDSAALISALRFSSLQYESGKVYACSRCDGKDSTSVEGGQH